MRVLTFPVLVASAVMAQVTLPANLNKAINVAADLDACATAANVLLDCADQVGGLDALWTVSPKALLGCACCPSQTPLANAYSSCSGYLSEEVSVATSEYEGELRACRRQEASLYHGPAYGMIYSVCRLEDCGGESDLPTPTPIDTTASTACWDMLDVLDTCMQETPGFADMPLISQAPCYCCHTQGGEVVWTDELDDYASECAELATAGEPLTAIPAASRYSSFCNNFSDACEATTTVSESESITTVVDTATETETDTPTGSETELTDTQETGQPETTDASVELRVGSAAGLVIALAFAALW